MKFHLPRYDDGSGESERIDNMVQSLYRADKLYPVIEKEGKLFRIKQACPYSTAFTWEPEIIGESDPGLTKIGPVLRTLHRYGAPAFFKPSIFEVFAQLPEFKHDLDYIHAFRIEPSDKPTSEWSDIEHEAMNAGFHVAYMTTYSIKGERSSFGNGYTLVKR